MKNWGPLLAMTILLILAACEVTPTPPQAVKSRATATVGGNGEICQRPAGSSWASARNGVKSGFRWLERSLLSARISIIPLPPPRSITMRRLEFARWRARSRGTGGAGLAGPGRGISDD